jgi:transcriptional regulator with XRE-family HTH domain
MAIPDSGPVTTNRLDELGRTVAKYAAIITALISVAVPLTEWLRGISNQKIKETEQRSMLAITYLDRIASKETSHPDRIMFLSALANLKDHPLQSWAQEYEALQKKQLDEIKEIVRKLQTAVAGKNEAQARVESLRAEIGIAGVRLQSAGTSQEIDTFRQSLTKLSLEMSEAEKNVAAKQTDITLASEVASAKVITSGVDPQLFELLKELIGRETKYQQSQSQILAEQNRLALEAIKRIREEPTRETSAPVSSNK